MYVTIEDFIREWNREAMLTQKVLEGLTDDSLKQKFIQKGVLWEELSGISQQIFQNI